MNALLIKLLNMSAAGSVLILAVLVLRALLKKAPRWIICLMWALAAIRLVCPVSIASPVSAFRATPSIVSESGEVEVFRPAGGSEKPLLAVDTVQIERPRTSSETIREIPGTEFAVTQRSRDAYLPPLAMGWLIGVGAMLVYAGLSTWLLERKVRASLRLEGNVRLCDTIPSPFILGLARPVIYLPSSLNEEEKRFVLAHERAHLQRRDHWWKPLGFLILSVHWFNPFCWLAYVLLCRDIELACDEKVIRELGRAERAAYSQTLLNCSARRILAACPVAFGETGVKTRVKAVLNYKKPAFWIILAAVLACIVLIVCFATNPIQEQDLSFLNYKNAISLIGQNDTAPYANLYPADSDGVQPGVADGKALAQLLESAKWTKRRAPSSSPEPRPYIEFIIEDDYRIILYQSERLAAVRFGNDVRYYRTAAGDYEAALAAFIPAPSTEPDLEPLTVEFTTKYGTGMEMAPLATKILFSGAYTAAEVNGHSYAFERGIGEAECQRFIEAEEQLLRQLGYDGELTVRVLSDYTCFSDSAAATLYLGSDACQSWRQILATLGVVHGDYTNYGFLYAQAERLAVALGWQRDGDARADPSVFTDDPTLLNLVYPCFDSDYVSSREIAACKALALSLNGETEAEFMAGAAAYARQLGLNFTPTGIRFAPYGEACPLKLRTQYVEVFRLSDFSGEYYFREGYTDTDFFADAGTLLRTFDWLDGQLAALRTRMGVRDAPQLRVLLTDGRYQISGTSHLAHSYGSPENVNFYYSTCSLYMLGQCYTQYLFVLLGGRNDPAFENWMEGAVIHTFALGAQYEQMRMNIPRRNPALQQKIEELLGHPFEEPEDCLRFMRLYVKEPETAAKIGDFRVFLKTYDDLQPLFGDYFICTYGEDVFLECMLAPSTAQERTGKMIDEIIEDFCTDLVQP